eukprot:TRINITY_DN9997_c0_g2_i3.p2 TRINITY_DN9997_c0_g2~~TRINITY_DN9997_c0_g2_i3.p2  ORF type:complete len:143 (+),score=26.24 TRINITY_DN9997_c0_g2_i3:22-429(+)
MASSSSQAHASAKVNVVMCGTGEYTTGYVHNSGSKSDKKVGVVGLCMFELRRLGHVGEISCVGTNGTKFPGIREHLSKNISQVYNGLDVSMQTYPADDVDRDTTACTSEARWFDLITSPLMCAAFHATMLTLIAP